jgi:hypothetical protein
VLDTGHFLIAQASTGRRTLLEIRLARRADEDMKALPSAFCGDGLLVAAQLINSLRALMSFGGGGQGG